MCPCKGDSEVFWLTDLCSAVTFGECRLAGCLPLHPGGKMVQNCMRPNAIPASSDDSI